MYIKLMFLLVTIKHLAFNSFFLQSSFFLSLREKKKTKSSGWDVEWRAPDVALGTGAMRSGFGGDLVNAVIQDLENKSRIIHFVRYSASHASVSEIQTLMKCMQFSVSGVLILVGRRVGGKGGGEG